MSSFSLLVLLNILPGLTQGGISSAVTDLSADDQAIRGRGVSVLQRASSDNPLVLHDHAVQDGLLDLLARETQRIRANFIAVQEGQPPLLAPESMGYYFDVLGLTVTLLDIGDIRPTFRPRLLSELVRSTYNPDSPFAGRLSREGGRIVPAIVELGQSEISPERWNAYSLIAMVFQGQDAEALAVPLSDDAQEQLRLEARRGLRDPASGVRRWAIGAVVAGRDTRAIPMLEQLAVSDPDSGEGRPDALRRNSVRSRAAEALKILREIGR
jgi:hypothetical protein